MAHLFVPYNVFQFFSILTHIQAIHFELLVNRFRALNMQAFVTWP